MPDDFPIVLRRNETVTGYEWWLKIETEGRALTSAVPDPGVFTDRDARPEEVLPKVLRKVMA
jgi:hypothetical protein